MKNIVQTKKLVALLLGLLTLQCQGMHKKKLKGDRKGIIEQTVFDEKRLNNFRPQLLRDFTRTGQSYGAGVMPYYEENGEQYVLLGREVNSKEKREWAFFSGGSEKSSSNVKLMEHPLDCAAREFYEEAILHKTLGWTESDVKEYIAKNTTEVIAWYGREVHCSRPLIIYQVKFQKKQLEILIEKFKDLFNDKNLDEKFKEKDALAFVKHTDLINAVVKNELHVKLDKTVPFWFNKDEEDTALMFYMPYALLRARHATQETFYVWGKQYQNVKDIISTQLKYHFFAHEHINGTLQSKL